MTDRPRIVADYVCRWCHQWFVVPSLTRWHEAGHCPYRPEEDDPD